MEGGGTVARFAKNRIRNALLLCVMQPDQVPGVLRANDPLIQVKIPKIKTRCHKLLADESDNDMVFWSHYKFNVNHI